MGIRTNESPGRTGATAGRNGAMAGCIGAIADLFPRTLLALAMITAAAGLAGAALTPAERNGIALVLPPDRTGYVNALKKAIQESARFRLVQPAPGGIHVKLPGLLPDPPLTVPQRNAIRDRTVARWLFFAAINRRTEHIEEYGQQVATMSLDVSARALDLDMGDFTPLMSLSGRDLAELAAQTVKFLRVQYPLQGRVTAVRDGTVYLDLGHKDGVDRGTYFVVKRTAGAYSEKVGTVVVTSSSDWYAVAEVDEQVLGRTVKAGDVAIEDTSAILARP